MDKQKEIEEMAKTMCVFSTSCEKCENYSECDLIAHSIILYEQGYQKIDKDSVVLTREEAERFRGQTINLKKIKSQARKETAEKILNDIYRYNGSLFGTCFHKGHYVSDVRDLVKDIAEEYEVEIKE